MIEHAGVQILSRYHLDGSLVKNHQATLDLRLFRSLPKSLLRTKDCAECSKAIVVRVAVAATLRYAEFGFPLLVAFRSLLLDVIWIW